VFQLLLYYSKYFIMDEPAPNAVLEKAVAGYCQGNRKGCRWLLSR